MLLWELLLSIFYHLLGFILLPHCCCPHFAHPFFLFPVSLPQGAVLYLMLFWGGPLFSLASAALIHTHGFWTAFNSCSLVHHLLHDIFGSFLLSFSCVCPPAGWPNGLKPRVFSLKLVSPPDFSIGWLKEVSSWSRGENSSHQFQLPQRRLPWSVSSLPSPVVSTVSYLGPHTGLAASSFLLLHSPLGKLWHQVPWHVTLVLSLIMSITCQTLAHSSVGIQGHPPSNRPTFPTSFLQTPLPVPLLCSRAFSSLLVILLTLFPQQGLPLP